MKKPAIDPAESVNPSQPEKIRAMIVIDGSQWADSLASALARIPQAYSDILILGGESERLPIRMDPRSIHYKARPNDEPPILTACTLARRKGISHVVTLGRDAGFSHDHLQTAYNQICRDRDAVLLGRSATTDPDGTDAAHRNRSLAGFWLRLQTGIRTADPRSGLRVYPVTVLENLKVHSRRPYLFAMEVLVRAAWAGVTLKEVDLGVSESASGALKISSGRISLADRFWMLILNIHLTMRSITPLPHKKIVADSHRPGEKISVLHPLRSIRTLLTENASPGQLSLTAALGVFLGALPLIALHNVTILFAAGYFRLNKVAALVASQLCMPPLVPALCIEAGYFMRNGEFLTEFTIQTIGYQAHQRLLEWLLGSLLLAPVLAALVGGTVYFLAFFIRKRILQKE